MRAEPAKTVDEYISQIQSEESRKALESLRIIIRSEIPEAQEVISYGIPTFKFYGMLVSFAAFKNHCSLFPGHTVAEFEKQLSGYKTSKGTIQFLPEDPLPESLVRAIVRRRSQENRQAYEAKNVKKSPVDGNPQ